MYDPVKTYQLCILAKSYMDRKSEPGRFIGRARRLDLESLNRSRLRSWYYALAKMFTTEAEARNIIALSAFWEGNVMYCVENIQDLKRQLAFVKAFSYNYEKDVKKLKRTDMTDGTIFSKLVAKEISPFTFGVLDFKYDFPYDEQDLYRRGVKRRARRLCKIVGVLT